MPSPAQLVAAARAGELPELTTGHSNAVFDGGALVVKRFKSQARSEPHREWEALRLLAEMEPGIVPAAVHLDVGEPACLVTERVAGVPVDVGLVEREPRVVDALCRVHRTVAAVGQRRGLMLPAAITHPSLLRWRITAQLARAGATGREDVAADLVTIGRWLETDEAELAGSWTRQTFSRGDAKLANYLWTGDAIVLLDLEDTGWGDPRHDVAEMAEHLWNRDMPPSVWEAVAEAVGVDPRGAPMLASRRLLASFWLAALLPHDDAHADGRVAVQLERTRSLLG